MSKLAEANNIAAAFGLYPEEKDANGVWKPVILEWVKLKDIWYTLLRLYPDGTKVNYNGFSNYTYSNFSHESGSATPAVFMTGSATSTTPISPATGNFAGVQVNTVGAMYLTKLRQFYAPPYNFLVRPTTSGQSFQFQYKFEFQFKYKGVTQSYTIGMDRCWIRVLMADATAYPSITKIEKPSQNAIAASGGSSLPEILVAQGKYTPLFKLECTENLASTWVTIPYTSDNFVHAVGGNCTWTLHGLPDLPSRYYRFRYEGTPQYYVPQ